MIVKLKNVRLAFPNLFEPKAFQGEGEKAYSASFLIDPVAQADIIREIEKTMVAVAKERWGGKAEANYKALKAADKLCLRDGNNKPDSAGFPGMMYLATRSATLKPYICDRDPTVKLEKGSGRPYGGCYVNANVDIWVQENAYGKRINATTNGVQFVRDGDAFAGGAPSTDSDFDDVSDFTGEPSPAPGDEAALF